MDFYFPNKARIPTLFPLWWARNDLFTTHNFWSSPHPWLLVHYSFTFWFLQTFLMIPSPAPLSTFLDGRHSLQPLLFYTFSQGCPSHQCSDYSQTASLHISISNNQLHISTWLVLPTSQIQSFKAEFLIYLSQTYLTMLRTFIKGTQVGIISNFSLCLSHLPHSVALNQIFFHHLISSPTTYDLYDLEQLIFPTLPCLISKIKIIFLTCQGACKN